MLIKNLQSQQNTKKTGLHMKFKLQKIRNSLQSQENQRLIFKYKKMCQTTNMCSTHANKTMEISLHLLEKKARKRSNAKKFSRKQAYKEISI